MRPVLWRRVPTGNVPLVVDRQLREFFHFYGVVDLGIQFTEVRPSVALRMAFICDTDHTWAPAGLCSFDEGRERGGLRRAPKRWKQHSEQATKGVEEQTSGPLVGANNGGKDVRLRKVSEGVTRTGTGGRQERWGGGRQRVDVAGLTVCKPSCERGEVV